jgi:DNA-binding MarR family transcriptional regulator
LTNKEIEVLALFMSLKGDIADQDRFGTQCRKMVMAKLGLKPGGLGNYLRALEEKGYISKKGKQFEVNPFIVPDPQRQGYQFLIEME